jgi:hypothetical protein
MSRFVLGPALGAGLGAALAVSQAAADDFPCHAFRPNPDGSWTVVQPVAIQVSNGLVELTPGATFPRVVAFGNFDLVALIERHCR